MSLVDRCGGCDDLVPLCRCERSHLHESRFGLIDPNNPPELRPENKDKWHED